MSEDPRCCGSGTCIIDPEGRCWCGQQWDGQKMAAPPRPFTKPVLEPDLEPDASAASGPDASGKVTGHLRFHLPP